MRKKERYEKVIAWFQEHVPVAQTYLHTTIRSNCCSPSSCLRNAQTSV